MYDYSNVSKQLNTETRDKEEIRKNKELEYSITSVRRERLEKDPIQGDYDLNHLSKIHEKLFEKLYEFAGKPRDFNFTKGLIHNEQDKYKGIFSDHAKINDLIDSASVEIRENNYFKDCQTTSEFVEKIAPLYAKFNDAHPFEEGNGRAIKTMFNQLANDAGFHINFDKSNSKDWNFASLKSMEHAQYIESMREFSSKSATNEYLIEEFSKIVSKKQTQENEVTNIHEKIYSAIPNAKLVTARPGETTGKIVFETDNFSIQQLGKDSKFFMLHDKKSFEKIPEVGSEVKIKRTNESAKVTAIQITNDKKLSR